MIVFTRRKNESLVIGGAVEVCIVEIRGDRVRLGIESPRDVSVYRGEVHAAMQLEAAAREAADSERSSGERRAADGQTAESATGGDDAPAGNRPPV